jgi:L-asparaginase
MTCGQYGGWSFIQYLYFYPAFLEMQSAMTSPLAKTVILGTGGTIAGTAGAGDNIGYTAAQLGVAELVRRVPALSGVPLEVEQVAQLDSKDMDVATWRALARRVAFHLARADVSGVVITHGTDTLEETGYLLHRVLAPAKPVVLAAAMRPATALQADGPQNVLDAVSVAREPGAHGVVAVLAGAVWLAGEMRKVHSYRLDAFSAGDAGPLGWVEEGALRQLRPWPAGATLGVALLERADWPRVEIVFSHAGADGRLVDLLVRDGVGGLVVAATGNGTVHHEVEAALVRAQAQGVRVMRSTRVGAGAVLVKPGDALPSAGTLTPVQARVELLLQLLASR